MHACSSDAWQYVMHELKTVSCGLFCFQVAIAGLTRFFEDFADVTYVSAPHAASGPAYPEVLQYFEPPFFEWWNAIQVVRGFTPCPSAPNEHQVINSQFLRTMLRATRFGISRE